MKLKVRINNQEFSGNLVQDCTFTEEYTETLDSATIILTQVKKIKDLKPYDDVYIYDIENGYNNRFVGFDDKGNLYNEDETLLKDYQIKFYKHMLVDQFTEERLDLQYDEETNTCSSKLYKYKIQLFSETKGLETIQLPNISITQPLNINKKISVYDYLKQFIDMYSPKIKKVNNSTSKIWNYVTKYRLSPSICDLLDGDNGETMEEVFGNIYSPDFTLNSPNLKDVLSQLMIVKDRIPVVYNNVIYAMDITKRRGKFNFNAGSINYVVSSNSSSNYADNLRRTYSGALSQDKTCKVVEYLGFRNKDNALMKLSDLRIETGFPIYKINKVYMCYYKKAIITQKDGITDTGKRIAFLCKQDITDFVKLNSERNLLNQDFDDFEDESNEQFEPLKIDEATKYKVATVGYDIGSNYITGWGERYQYIRSPHWKEDKTVIENIFNIVDYYNPYGIYVENHISGYLGENERLAVNSIQNKINGEMKQVLSVFTNNSLKFKGFFFEVEYDAFYNGSIIHTKDLATSDITINDNSGSSLTLLEKDGVSQKEKINRFGNKNYVIPARYTDYKDIQGLGSWYDDDNDTDIIIYRKEYSVSGNVINCTYQGMKDYVLKNFFTSVYAKHRPYNLMSYGESVTRAENKKMMLYFSKKKKYYENGNLIGSFENFTDKFLTFTKPSKVGTNLIIENNDKINYGYLTINSPDYDNDGNIKQENGKDKYVPTKYASDLNAFVSGNSMCFNMTMTDNVSMGVYIKKATPFVDEKFDKDDVIDPTDDYTGSLQTWYMTTDDIETGFAKTIGFYVGHENKRNDENDYIDTIIEYNSADKLNEDYYVQDRINELYNRIFSLPKIVIDENYLTNKIGNNFTINKDNKEIINMTYQIEPITDDENIVLSPWVSKLSDLIGTYNKFEQDETKVLYSYKDLQIDIAATTVNTGRLNDICMFMSIENQSLSSLKKGIKIVSEDKIIFKNDDVKGWYSYFEFQPKEIYDCKFMDKETIEVKDTYSDGDDLLYITLAGKVTVKRKNATGKKETEKSFDGVIEFRNIEISSPGQKVGITWTLESNKTYLCNLKFYLGQTIHWNTPYIYDSYGEEINNGFYFNPWLNGDLTSIYNDNSEIFSPVFVNDETELETYTFAKNMFIIFDQNEINKNNIYKEFSADIENYTGSNYDKNKFKSLLLENKQEKVSDYIKITKDNFGSTCIKLNNYEEKDFKSIQLWYLDNIKNGEKPDFSKASYKFVFGVNLTQEEKEKGEIDIYISNLSTLNKKVYNKKNLLIGNTTDYKNDANILLLETPDEERENKKYFIKIPYETIEKYSKFNFEKTEKITLSYDGELDDYKSEITKNNEVLSFKLVKKTYNSYAPYTITFNLIDDNFICELDGKAEIFDFKFYNSRDYYDLSKKVENDKTILSLPFNFIYDYKIRDLKTQKIELSTIDTFGETNAYVRNSYNITVNENEIKKYSNINPSNISYFTFKIHSIDNYNYYEYTSCYKYDLDFSGRRYNFDKVLEEFYSWFEKLIIYGFKPNTYTVEFEINFKEYVPNSELDLYLSGFKFILCYSETGGSPWTKTIDSVNTLTNVQVPGTGKTKQLVLRFDADLTGTLENFKNKNKLILQSNFLPETNPVAMSFDRIEETGGFEKYNFELEDNLLVCKVDGTNSVIIDTFDVSFVEEGTIYSTKEDVILTLYLSNKFVRSMYGTNEIYEPYEINALVRYYDLLGVEQQITLSYNPIVGKQNDKYYLKLICKTKGILDEIIFVQEKENDYYNVAKIETIKIYNNYPINKISILDLSFSKFDLHSNDIKEYGRQHYTTFDEQEAE